jgi:outer membrane protein assembly factor BamB
VAGTGNGVVSDGVVYLIVATSGQAGATTGGDLIALDVRTGGQKWRTPMPQGSWLDVRVGGVLTGVVFVVGSSGAAPFLWAVDAVSGAGLWQKDGVQFTALMVPAVGTQIMTAGSPDPNTPVTAVAIDIRTGDQEWTHQLGTSVDYSHVSLNKAAYAGDRYVLLVAAQDTDGLFAGFPSSGEMAWNLPLPEPQGDAGTVALITRSPDSNAVFAVSRRGLYAADARAGRLLWQSQGTEFFATGSDSGAPQVADGNVYVYDQKGTWWAVDAASGKTRWKYTADGFDRGTDPLWIALAGGVVFSAGGKLVMIAAKG